MLHRSFLLVFLLAAACDNTGTDPTDAGMDASVDAGSDAGRDAGPRWVGPGCNETMGIECDGDWAGHCAGGCAETECCSPQVAMSSTRSEFVCVPRGADGSCPAANIWVDEARIVNEATGEDFTTVQWQFFAETDCAIAEGCVDAPGWRRLLRFATWTPNTGTADLYLGPPDTSSPQFEYSACHDHYHFNGYAEYELRNPTDSAVVATGHKQAFCLLDFYRYPGTDATGYHYECTNQGIQRGWQDVYDETLDCQWIDVTDVAPGDYDLVIDLNVDRTLLESSYDDNHAEVRVTIPADAPVDVTQPCATAREGDVRDCGWVRQAQAEPFACTPGAMMRVACSAACGAGSCTGDSVLRVCDPAAMDTTTPNDCAGQAVLAHNDDSGCNFSDRCSQVQFVCPESAQFVAYSGAYNSAEAVTCTVAVAP